MLVPHTCTDEKDMYAEYVGVREEIALQKEDLRLLNGDSGQICETFGVHPQLEAVQGMYNDGALLSDCAMTKSGCVSTVLLLLLLIFNRRPVVLHQHGSVDKGNR